MPILHKGRRQKDKENKMQKNENEKVIKEEKQFNRK